MKKVLPNLLPPGPNLNQTPYDYTVDVKNRFKGLDLGDGVPVLVKNCGQRFVTLYGRQ